MKDKHAYHVWILLCVYIKVKVHDHCLERRHLKMICSVRMSCNPESIQPFYTDICQVFIHTRDTYKLQ